LSIDPTIGSFGRSWIAGFNSRTGKGGKVVTFWIVFFETGHTHSHAERSFGRLVDEARSYYSRLAPALFHLVQGDGSIS